MTTLLFGFAPVVQTLRLDLAASLKDTASSTSAGLKRQGLRGALAAAQMALAVRAAARRGPDAAQPRRAAARGPRLRAAPRPDPAGPAARGDLPEARGGRRVLPGSARARPRASGRARGRDRAIACRSRPRSATGASTSRATCRRPASTPRATGRSSPTARSKRSGERLLRGRPLAASDTADALPVVARQRDARAHVLARPGPDRQAPAHGFRRKRPSVDGGRRPSARRAAQRRDRRDQGEVLRSLRAVPEGARRRRGARDDDRRARRRRPDGARRTRSAPRCGASTRAFRWPTPGG